MKKRYEIIKLRKSMSFLKDKEAPHLSDSRIVLTKKELRDILKDIKKVLKED